MALVLLVISFARVLAHIDEGKEGGKAEADLAQPAGGIGGEIPGKKIGVKGQGAFHGGSSLSLD